MERHLPPELDYDTLFNGERHVLDLVALGWRSEEETVRTSLHQAARMRGLAARTSTKGLPRRHMAVTAYNSHPYGSLEYWLTEARLQRPCTCDSTMPNQHSWSCEKLTRPHDLTGIRAGVQQALDERLLALEEARQAIVAYDPAVGPSYGELIDVGWPTVAEPVDKPARAGSLEEFQQRLRSGA